MLGSVRQVAQTNGTVLDALTYDSYGNILTETNSANGDRFKYTGREWDSEIRLQFNRARYYDPNSGRWLSQDPIRFGAGDPNLYRYVRGAPTATNDPIGLDPYPFGWPKAMLMKGALLDPVSSAATAAIFEALNKGIDNTINDLANPSFPVRDGAQKGLREMALNYSPVFVTPRVRRALGRESSAPSARQSPERRRRLELYLLDFNLPLNPPLGWLPGW
jgi:RHS repeat-associated protein